MLLLHGGAGPASVDGFGGRLAAEGPKGQARVLVPTHPGFGGTPRPAGLDSIGGLARLYVRMIEDLGLDQVTVIGNSIGGWIAAEIALLPARGSAAWCWWTRPGWPWATTGAAFSLSMDQVAELSFYRPDAFRVDPALPAEQQAVMAANQAALATYAGPTMADPGLLGGCRASRCRS